MAQEHDEDSRHGPEKSDGTRHQPNDHLDVHHDPPFVTTTECHSGSADTFPCRDPINLQISEWRGEENDMRPSGGK
jgi:hypothetical protein